MSAAHDHGYFIEQVNGASGRYMVYRRIGRVIATISGHETKGDALWQIKQMEKFDRAAERYMKEKYGHENQ